MTFIFPRYNSPLSPVDCKGGRGGRGGGGQVYLAYLNMGGFLIYPQDVCVGLDDVTLTCEFLKTVPCAFPSPMRFKVEHRVCDGVEGEG